MSLDVIARLVAQTQIAKFGKTDVTLTRVIRGAYDPSLSSGAITTTDETINAVVEEYKGREIDNNNIRIGDKKLTIAASAVALPTLSDAITIDGKTFSIVTINTIYSGSLPALYIVQGRSA